MYEVETTSVKSVRRHIDQIHSSGAILDKDSSDRPLDLNTPIQPDTQFLPQSEIDKPQESRPDMVP